PQQAHRLRAWSVQVVQIVQAAAPSRIVLNGLNVLNAEQLLIQPHQLCRIVLQHYLDLVGLDAKTEQRTDENAHAIDGVHVQHLTEVAADDAAVGTDFSDGANGFHRVGNGLV